MLLVVQNEIKLRLTAELVRTR